MSSIEDNDNSDGLLEALSVEDDLGKVIRVFLYIESELHTFIKTTLEDYSHIEKLHLDFYSNVHLATALGMDFELKSPLLQIGNIRNTFAHKHNAKLDKNCINNLYNSFSLAQKKNITDICGSQEFSWIKNKKRWRQASISDQFMVMSLSLFYMLKIDHLRQQNKVQAMRLKASIYDLKNEKTA